MVWVAGILTGLAASVLVVASAWLWEAPAPATGRARVVFAPAPAAEWERVAMTLDAGPLNGVPGPPAGTDFPGRTVLADARLADWMLQNLSR